MENLPNEIQQLVFKDLRDNTSNILECILVCSSWKCIYQKLLYSNVGLSTFSQSEMFLNTVKENQHLRSLVVKLSLRFYDTHSNQRNFATITELFTLLFNLEYIDCCYFSLLLDALSMNHLPNLNYVKPPIEDKDVGDYAACTIALKDRIRNLAISNLDGNKDTDDGSENFNSQSEKCSAQYYRLFNRLGEFENIQELYIKKKSMDVIQMIEHVTRTCPSLRHLSVDASKYHANSVVDNNDEIMMPSLPIINITHLSICQNIIYNSPIMLYIINNFPQLKALDIFGGVGLKTFLDELTFDNLIYYLPKLKSVRVKGIHCKKKYVIDSIGNFWETLSQSRMVSIEVSHDLSCWKVTDMCKLSIDITDGEGKINMMYAPEFHVQQHLTLIESHGYLIDDLTFSKISITTDPEEESSFTTLILHPIRHCTKLKRLSLVQSTLKTARAFNDVEFEKKELDSLRLDGCRIIGKELVYKRLFGLFSYVKNLELIGIEPVNRPRDKCTEIKTIDMPHTDIGTLLISKKPASYDTDKTVVLVHVLTQQLSTYYHYDVSSMNDHLFKTVTESFYRNQYSASESFIIGFHYKSVKNLQVTHLEQVISVEVL